ncbi:MAG: hypothetical protein ACE37F_16910 [Nannocystaceae bacterium]|nr:hypothetical protein [bacterium]
MQRLLFASLLLVACSEASDEPSVPDHGEALDPEAAPRASVDRFGPARASNPDLPAPGEAIDFDAGFFRRGLGPDGATVSYYDFGVSTGFTMPAYRLVDGEGVAVEGQLWIVGELPGTTTYSDFWQVIDVEVPEAYVPNSITSAAEVEASGYPQTRTVEAFNRPLVPEGSLAQFASDDGALRSAWFEDQVVFALDFSESELSLRGDLIDYAPIYVCFTDDGRFCADDTGSTHNVVAAVPPDPAYSPLWKPSVYPESAFDDVSDLDTALAADPQTQPMLVNCPMAEW